MSRNKELEELKARNDAYFREQNNEWLLKKELNNSKYVTYNEDEHREYKDGYEKLEDYLRTRDREEAKNEALGLILAFVFIFIFMSIYFFIAS
ncbi:hypothetical protein DF188_09265 [Aliarcobacter skirrowii]|uniref:Uncharacterized protein n=1 Tax=Aliarcobacter skirrowii TaxID=28200 RepID=A0A2U2BYP6_9BACT|nr:hypothetical protein [Aliarcobacter skirrowii]PWE19833.1 hypothetical protein DF188_09265 [Aliarcobacter skirrowii]